MSDEQQLPPDPKTPSSMSPGDREFLDVIVSAIDRNTEAMTRIAAAFEKQAIAVNHLADRAREWMESNIRWEQGR